MAARSDRSARRAAAFAGAALLVGLVAACRQLVGIGDRTLATGADAGVDAGACGLALGPGDCRSCVESRCCAAAAACASAPACAQNEQCVGGCGTDEDCVEACQLAHPAGTVPSVPALDACLSAECSSQCELSCGSHTGFVASPDAGVACGACIAAHACTAAQACGDDLACETTYRCEVGCSTLDCATGCESDDAGTALFNVYGSLLLSDCAAACALGENWVCAGHVSWPEPTTTSLAIQAVVADVLSSSPTADADVKLCAKNDQGCVRPITESTTDADGAFTLHYTLTNTVQGGLDGYLLITSSAIAPSLFFWGFPLSQPVATFGIKISTVGATALPAFLGALKATQVAGHGMAFVGMLDCSHNPAVGVHVTIVDGSDSNTQILYGAGGGFSAAAQSTDGTGVALLVNLPVGPVHFSAATATGLVVSQGFFLVSDGAAEEVVALPTPQ